MIVSSFAQQYGIRLEKEKHTIKLREYRRLLIGLSGDTPLGQIINIRRETDPKKIKEMTNHEKQVRQEWIEFKNTQKKIVDKKQEEQKLLQVQNMLKSIFGR